jgi:hypothetical protein
MKDGGASKPRAYFANPTLLPALRVGRHGIRLGMEGKIDSEYRAWNSLYVLGVFQGRMISVHLKNKSACSPSLRDRGVEFLEHAPEFAGGGVIFSGQAKRKRGGGEVWPGGGAVEHGAVDFRAESRGGGLCGAA